MNLDSDVMARINPSISRLRWSIFEPLQNIRVFADTGNWKADKLHTIPFAGHPIATQHATEPSLNNIVFRIDT